MAKALSTLTVSGELWQHGRVSLCLPKPALPSVASLGLLLGLLTGRIRLVEMLLDTTLQMISNILALALIPLVIVWGWANVLPAR